MSNYSQFSYDGLWRNAKIIETVSGSVTSTKQFVWCGARRFEERDVTGALASRYFGAGAATTAGNYFYSNDHVGSIRELSNSSGVIYAQYQYFADGQTRKVSGSGTSTFGFIGSYVHERSELNLTKHRPYKAVLARWISRDPLGENAGVNLYNYCLNDAVNLKDTSGLLCECAQNCADFVKCLANYWASNSNNMGSMGGGGGGFMGAMQGALNSGKALANQLRMGKDILDQRDNSTLPSGTGFKNSLTAGGQGGQVGRHVIGGAGSSLSGMGFLADAHSVIDYIQGLQHPDHMTQSLAEIEGNKAGKEVGDAFKKADESKKDKDSAKQDLIDALMKILCDGDGKGGK